MSKRPRRFSHYAPAMPMATVEAQREYQREWIAKRRADWFTDKACARCGVTEDLRLDHIDPTKKISHKIWSWSAERRTAELAKCQVLCEPCHKDKTLIDIAERLGRELYQHGTHGMYVRHGCRCALCKAAHAATNRAWRQGRQKTLDDVTATT